jgi:hypothetical protein
VPKAIPFYGATDRRLFAIERRWTDHDRLVVGRLDELREPVTRYLDGRGRQAMQLGIE